MILCIKHFMFLAALSIVAIYAFQKKPKHCVLEFVQNKCRVPRTPSISIPCTLTSGPSFVIQNGNRKHKFSYSRNVAIFYGFVPPCYILYT